MPKQFFQLIGVFLASAILAFVVACAANSPAAEPKHAPMQATPTLAPTRLAQAEPSPTPLPRQHRGEHIEGLGEPLDAPHFVDSFPNHSQTLTLSPARVGINFDTPLTNASQLSIERDGKNIARGALEFDPRKIYMSAALPPNQGDGLYLVTYRACFVDDTCADGRVGFRVNSARVKNFLDLTHEKNVTIHLRDIKYLPNQIIISQGTTVTWVNDDSFEHFVNSDPHPSHNAHPKLNSLDIPPTGNFSYTFGESGEYTFHCSAHVPQNMFGTIIVRENVQAQISPTTAAPATLAPTTIAQTAPTSTSIPPTPAPSTRAPTAIPPTAIPPTVAPTSPQKVDAATLPQERFAAHYVFSEPAHADLLPSAPEKIQIHFDFVLARNSNFTILKDGEKLTLAAPEFSENRLSMSVALPDAGAGMYHVLYRACWPDKSCHDGEFAFMVQ